MGMCQNGSDFIYFGNQESRREQNIENSGKKYFRNQDEAVRYYRQNGGYIYKTDDGRFLVSTRKLTEKGE